MSKGLGFVDQRKTNHKRQAILSMEREGEIVQYWILFKREPFFSFGKIFKRQGSGESVNYSILQTIALGGYVILVVYENGKIYTYPANRWLEIAERERYIRRTKSGELTASIPIHLLNGF